MTNWALYEFMTGREAADLLGVSPSMIKFWRAKGILVGEKKGHQMLYARVQVEALRAVREAKASMADPPGGR